VRGALLEALSLQKIRSKKLLTAEFAEDFAKIAEDHEIPFACLRIRCELCG